MVIINREASLDERARILRDFDQILIKDGVPQSAPTRYSMVAEEDGKLVGYASGLKEHRWLYLTDLWVEERRRRQGIGTALPNRMEETARNEGMEHVYLWTSGFVNPLFYEKNGYRKFVVFEDFFEVEGYHQIGYRKDLL